jgi:hypothetical protein
MLTPLGYEEMRQLHQERLNRSLRRYEIEKALAASREEPTPVPCTVIELPSRAPLEERIGA